jgi:D-aminopeptidase
MRRILFVLLLALCAPAFAQSTSQRPRARDLNIEVGIFLPGPLNAITDVAGVLIGQSTLSRGDSIRTGVTAIVPEVMVRNDPNWTMHRLPAAVFVGNAYGKLMGSTQIEELGEIETPILLTSTLNVPRVADALLDFMLAIPYNREVRSMNVVVGETNDGYLNDIRSRPVGRDEVFTALRSAKSGPVDEGSVGAGTGTVAFGWKGGIGTSSRRLPKDLGGYTIGVLVQTNYGGVLSINGAPVGRELGQYEFRSVLEPKSSRLRSLLEDRANGSVMVIVATDAAVDSRNLKRMAARAMLGLGRTGAGGSNGSGDYAIAFSTMDVSSPATLVTNDQMSPLFLAVIEATEEAVYNSLFRATTVTGNGHTVEALPIDRTLEILRRHNAFKPLTLDH